MASIRRKLLLAGHLRSKLSIGTGKSRFWKVTQLRFIANYPGLTSRRDIRKVSESLTYIEDAKIYKGGEVD
jgi:hypothetical protein